MTDLLTIVVIFGVILAAAALANWIADDDDHGGER
jgi:hypothetical protein